MIRVYSSTCEYRQDDFITAIAVWRLLVLTRGEADNTFIKIDIIRG